MLYVGKNMAACIDPEHAAEGTVNRPYLLAT